MRNKTKRITDLDASVQSIPVTSEAVQSSLQRFRENGELPTHKRLAIRTVEEAMRLPRPISIRNTLLREAVSDLPAVPNAARLVLRLLIRAGLDVASRDFVDEDMELPKFGSIGLHLLGWPECLVKAPYEAQAKRVLKQIAKIQSRLCNDDAGLASLAKATGQFLQAGHLPKDEALRDSVVTYTEFLALHKHLGGGADAKVLAAFDRAAQVTGEERDAAIDAFQALCRLA